MNLQEGQKIGAYEIINPIGQGGMATVYKAYHERLDRFVAIKLMHETFLQDEDFRARFQREARIVARLEHPNIVQIYDYAEHENNPYLVMKYVEGTTLKRRAIKTGLTLYETYGFLNTIADGLDYAHRQGVLHRDMKPSNILVDKNDMPYITDFGLARIAEAGSSTISHDMMLGTPFYISPEQAQGSKDLDSRTDIYSLAVILYELITGRVPFQADTPYAIVHGHIYTQPEAPSKVNPELSDAIDTVLGRALAKNRDERYPTAKIMMQAFLEAIEGESNPSPKISALGTGGMVTDERTVMQDSRPIKPQAASSPVQPQITRSPQPPVVQSPIPQKGKDSEFNLDMGDLSWENLSEGLRSGVTSLAEMIEERIDTELRQRRGIAITEEEIARRRVVKRIKERQEFVGHLATYITVNGALIALWFITGADFFWPFFPIFFWGLGLAGQGIAYYNKYGPGAAKREEEIKVEVERELGRISYAQTQVEKPKKRDAARLEDVQSDGGVRLNEDGELTDSFVEEQRRRR
jgi:serine/threonine protein kinase